MLGFRETAGKVARSNQVQDSDSDPRGTCFEETMSLLENGMSRGNIYSLKAVWTYFSRRLELHYHLDPGVYRGNKFKEKIQRFLHNKVSFVQPMNPSESLLIVSTNLSESVLRSLLKVPNLEPGDDEEMLYNNDVVKVHNDIKSAPGHNCIGNINEKSAEEVVPESLFMLITMLCAGGNDNEEGANVEMKMRVLSICQDIVFLASRERKLTPKQCWLGPSCASGNAF